MSAERLKLVGSQRTRYFAPVAIFVYLAALCVAMIITAAFLTNKREAVAVAAAGVFGLILAGGMGAVVLFVQLRELRYLTVVTQADARTNFALVQRLAQRLGWQITQEVPGQRLEATTPEKMSQEGEIVAVQLRQREVLIASICNPEVGFSLLGRKRCQVNRELLRSAVLSSSREQLS